MKWEIVAVVVLAVAPYLNSMRGEFVLDDDRAVRDNADVDWATDMSKVFVNDFWGTPLRSNASHKSYRPLTVLTFKATHLVSGLNPTAYHIGNMVLYAVTCSMWWAFVTDLKVLSRKGTLFASFFFALHPMHVENVASIVGRADVLCFLFMMLSILAYLKRTVVGYTAAVCFCLLATFSKELGIVTLAVAAAFDLIINSRLLHRQLDKRGVLLTVVSAALSIAILVGSMRMRGDRMTPKMSFIDNPISFYKTGGEKLSHYTYVHAWYFLLSVFPNWSCSDWGFNVLPKEHSPFPAFIAYSLLISFPFAALFTRYRNACALGTVLIVIPFLPASGIVPVGTVLAERLLFIPTAGFAIWGGLLLDISLAKLGKRRSGVAYVCVAVLLTFFAYKTTMRSDDWNTPEKLFTGTIETCPSSAKAQYSLGVVYMQRQDVKKAVPHFEAALKAYPEYAEALVGLGRILKDAGKLDDSVPYFMKALNSEPKHVDANHHLGVVLSQRGNATEGIRLIEKALRIHKSLLLPNTPSDLYGNYAAALGMAGRMADSIAAFRSALSYPGTVMSTRCLWNRNLAVLYLKDKQYDYAEEQLTLILNPPCGASLSKAERDTYQKNLKTIQNAKDKAKQ
eukprot:TRINITY_DN37335_c0_g1_i1.p1 TRINITY_DN37335_c0_g1~~TRINITY_DN37335_c0_g1_i1.p1  ORF type:complete len:643 (+),score=175.98 TRINITY_DN37335_c0_g1_i1:65-1930(+)